MIERNIALLRALLFTQLYLYVLVTGVFWGTWFSLSRSIATITPSTFLEIGHTMIRNLGGPMSLLMPTAILSNVAVSVMLYRRSEIRAFGLATAALVLLLAARLITLTVNVPSDNEIAVWTVTTLPPDWETIRDRWHFYHSLRTFASLLGLGCAFGSVLATPAFMRTTMTDRNNLPREKGVL
jgi:uncharacterized membrane protein